MLLLKDLCLPSWDSFDRRSSKLLIRRAPTFAHSLRLSLVSYSRRCTTRLSDSVCCLSCVACTVFLSITVFSPMCYLMKL